MFQPSCFLLPPKNPSAFCCTIDIFKNRGFQENIYSFLLSPVPNARTSIAHRGVLPPIVPRHRLCSSRGAAGTAGGCRHGAHVSCHLSSPEPHRCSEDQTVMRTDEGHFPHKRSSFSNTGREDVLSRGSAGEGGQLGGLFRSLEWETSAQGSKGCSL